MNDQSELSQEVQLESPGSLMSSTIHSHQLSSFEIDEASSVGVASRKVNQNWRLGMPWFVGASSSTSPRDLAGDKSPRYYGGLMKAEEALLPDATGTKKKRSFRVARKGAFRFGRRIKSVTSADEESIGDFSKSDWTPQDSAYGAACPVCGCIPKHMRRMIELSLIGLMVLVFLWMVVTLSSHISNVHRNAAVKNTTDVYGGNVIGLNDDYYVENNSTFWSYNGGG